MNILASPSVGLISVDIKNFRQANGSELKELTESAGGNVAFEVIYKKNIYSPALFLSPGKLNEIKHEKQKNNVNLLIFRNELSPVQQRNLSNFFGCRVIDRVALILDIFALRARTHEGKLQVELAQLEYLSTRLVRGWTHLERQRGGIGLRGPGETQLETDRRLLGIRVKRLKQDLKKFSKQRNNRRRSREKGGSYNVSLVGYTNSGKSTIFNVFTNAGVHAANQLFATLDTTSRRVYLDKNQFMVLSDTVGFIKDLPHSLIESFKATLTETVKSDLLVHVVDYSDENWKQHFQDVLDVLKEVGANDIPRINLFNKIDLVDEDPRIAHDQYGRIECVWISAGNKQGVDLVKKAVVSHKMFDDSNFAKGSLSCISEVSSLNKNMKDTYPSSSSLI